MLSGNHDNGHTVAGGQVGVDAGVDDVEVVGTPDLGVGVHNAGAVILSTDTSSTNPMVAAGVLLGQALGSGVASNGKNAVGLPGEVDELLDGGQGRLTVVIRVEVGLVDNGRITRARNAKGTGRRSSVSHVKLDLESVVRRSVAGTLVEVLASVSSLDAGPVDEALARLGQKTGALGKEIDIGLTGAGESSAVEGSQGILGLQCDSEDGVVLQMLADGEIDPVSAGRELDTGGTVGDSLDLCLRTDTTVEENSGGGESTRGQDDRTTRLQVDDLTSAAAVVDLDTSNGFAVAHNANNLGLQGEGEVRHLLSEREVIPNRASAETVRRLWQ